MSPPLFDDQLLGMRRARASRIGGDAFLHQRAFDDCLDRLGTVRRHFDTARIAGSSRPAWRETLAPFADRIEIGGLFDPTSLVPGSADLILSIGDLEATNDLPAAAFALRQVLRPGGLLLGALVGGNSLPRLRMAMLAADRSSNRAAQRMHPAIDGPSLAGLLTLVGFTDPVIDVDRVDVAYPSFDRLVADLRATGCTNVLAGQSRAPLNRSALEIARREFLGGGDCATERFELLHFAAWAPKL